MNGLSLFSSAGIGETYLEDIGVNIIVANELIERRADLHNKLYPNCKCVCGDITDSKVFSEVIESSKGIEFLLASPPCQGMSWIGKNKHQEEYIMDPRNYLIKSVFDAIEQLKPSYVMIENVEKLLVFKMPYKDGLHTLSNMRITQTIAQHICLKKFLRKDLICSMMWKHIELVVQGILT